MWIRLAYSPTARSYRAIIAPTDLGVTSSTVNVIDSLLFEYNADLVPYKTKPRQTGKMLDRMMTDNKHQ